MEDNEIVDEYSGRTLSISNWMATYGKRIEKVLVIEKILRWMTIRFNYVRRFIKDWNDMKNFSIDELQSSLLMHEQRMKRSKRLHWEKVLKISNPGKGTVKAR